jgi:hypothetical protein
MKKLLHKTKETLQSGHQRPNHPITSDSQPTTAPPPTYLDVLRYRSHHGVNLGSIFVLEKWLFPSMFEPGLKGDSELDAVTAYSTPMPPSLPRADTVKVNRRIRC